jgi:retron-type reverse transcriptase
MATRSLYDKTSVIIDLGYETTSEIKTNKGVRQGCSISPTLFNIYIDGMFRTWKSKTHQGINLRRNSFF